MAVFKNFVSVLKFYDNAITAAQCLSFLLFGLEKEVLLRSVGMRLRLR